MTTDPLDRITEFVTTHNRLVILLLVVLTGVMVVGLASLDTGSQAGGTTDAFPDTDVSAAADYVDEHYGQADGRAAGALSAVYVRSEDGNALSKSALLEALRYQRTVASHEDVAESLRGVTGLPTLVGTRAAGDPGADLDTQIAALSAMDTDAVAELVETTLSANSEALALVPREYEPGTASATSHRLLFQFEAGADDSVPSDAQRILYETARGHGSQDFFTLGEHARAQNSQQLNQNTFELILPFALVLIVGVLAFAYRDPVDVLAGMTGVLVSIVWMFGILGWLGVSAGMTMLIGPVLVAGLSIDFGFHVFTRYREQRVDGDGIRNSMQRAMRGVAVALGLVTVTAAIGFLSNLVNPVASIRDLGVGITLGVVAAFVIFMTLVPALKLSIDGLLERVGFDRRKQPLGDGAAVRPLLSGCVQLAKRAPVLIVVIALIASAGGAVAWTALDEQSFQQQRGTAADWKQDLPEPLAWDVPEYQHDSQYVQDAYRPVASGADDRFQLLVRGAVTNGATLDRIATVTDRPVFGTDGAPNSVRSPVTVLQAVAQSDPAVDATVQAADTDGDGIPDRNLAAVFDALYDAAPEQADRVIERRADGYQSLRVIGPAESAGFTDDRTDDIREAAAALGAEPGLSATAVSQATILDSQLGVVTDGIVRVLVLALGAVFVGLVLVYRWGHDSAVAGVLTAAPIAMVTSLVVGGMYVLDVPLTLVTALLMSLVVGLGIDYNIHVSDRFLQEIDRGVDPMAALETAVTSTGGALLGSTLTSAGAFASLLLHPHPQMQSFGILVILTLGTALVVSTIVLPSLLTIWVRYGGVPVSTTARVTEPRPDSGDD